MRAERRHELETNVLADTLGRVLKDYGTHLKVAGIVFAALLLGWLVYQMIATSESRHAAEAWEQFMMAREPEDYERIIREYQGLPAAYWAMLELADLEYSMGLDRMARNPEEAETYIKKALERYREAFKAAGQLNRVDPAFGGRALLGQAHCLEALGDREGALAIYEQILKEYPDTWMAERAADRIAELKQPGAAEFYASLRRAAAVRPATQAPGGEVPLLPGITPGEGSQVAPSKTETEPEAEKETEKPPAAKSGATEESAGQPEGDRSSGSPGPGADTPAPSEAQETPKNAPAPANSDN